MTETEAELVEFMRWLFMEWIALMRQIVTVAFGMLFLLAVGLLGVEYLKLMLLLP